MLLNSGLCHYIIVNVNDALFLQRQVHARIVCAFQISMEVGLFNRSLKLLLYKRKHCFLNYFMYHALILFM